METFYILHILHFTFYFATVHTIENTGFLVEGKRWRGNLRLMRN